MTEAAGAAAECLLPDAHLLLKQFIERFGIKNGAPLARRMECPPTLRFSFLTSDLFIERNK